MSEEERTRLPVDEAEPRRQNVSLSGWVDVTPGLCADCSAAVSGDAHFCPSCGSFLAAPHVGALATPKRRLGAFVIDGVLRDGGLLGPYIWPAIMPDGAGKVFVSILSAVYGLASLYLWTKGTTPAKRLLNMKVVNEDGEPPGFFRMAFRETIGKMISGLAVGLGYLAITTDDERQGWHDRMAGTWVVHDDD